MTASVTGSGSGERPRVGLWLGLLLLFVPIFYPLLFFKRYSWLARLGWGAWLGLIVFVKVSGLSEPVIDLTRIESELRQQEQAPPSPGVPAAPAPSARSTFVEPEHAAIPAPPLETYLRELGGGVLGRRMVDYRVEGDAIRIRFQAMDWYLDSEAAVSLESIGAALSLFYGRDFRRVELDYVYQGRPLRVALTRDEFNAFFGMSEDAVRALLADRTRLETSVFHAERMPAELRAGFFERFAKYE
jgi:hypothetical protein